MNKEEFLKKLDKKLAVLSEKERKEKILLMSIEILFQKS